MTNIIVTIAICTWNRAESLRTTLASLRDMKDTGGVEWEVLIINNNCTDNTEGVVADFVDVLPIRSLTETNQGLSPARNCAVSAARGSYIVFTDDDTIVDAQWLAAYIDAFRAWPNAAVFGGPIIPKFVGQPPAWLLQALRDCDIDGVYALRDLGTEPIALDVESDKIPYGANYAVRMREQSQFPYNPHLGPRKSDNIRGEDVDSLGRILGSGAEGRWVPKAIVHHVIPKDRQTTAYLREWFVGQGRTEVRRSPARYEALLMGAPRWLWRAAITSEISFRLKQMYCPPRIWCRQLATASNYWGQIWEYRTSLHVH